MSSSYDNSEREPTKEDKYHQMYLQHALVASTMSHAKKLKVGCIVVKDGKMISDGWNGMPAGWDNNCEDYEWPANILKTKPEVLHAEENALMKIAKSTDSSKGATMYITHPPCIHCAKLIHGAGIVEVIYANTYPTGKTQAGQDFLDKCNIPTGLFVTYVLV